MGREAIKIPQVRSVYGDQIICDGGPFGVGRQGGVSAYYPVGADCVLYHAYWDGTATNHASSGSGHDGTVVGASFGTYGLTFDGNDDKVTAGNLTEINNLSEMTIYIWKAWTNDNASLDYCISRGDASVYVGMADYSSSYGLVMPGYGHTTAATSTVWQMWALVFDGAGALNADKLKIYLNTSSQAITFDANMPIVTPTIADALFIVGTFRDGSSYPWKGIIGEVLVFNEAKDATALTAYYNATKSRYGL